MPAAIPAIVAGAGLSAGAVIAIQIGSMVVLNALSRKLQDRGNRNLSKHDSNQREFTVRAVDAYETFVYGKTLVGGVTVYQNAVTTDPSGARNNRYLHVIKWVGHRVNCMEFFKLDDRILHPTSGNIEWNPQTYVGSGFVQAGTFRGSTVSAGASPTRMRWYNGAQTSADYWMTQYTPDWSLDMVGKNRTYGILEIQQIQEDGLTDAVYAQGIPDDVFAYVHGKSAFDPRKSALNGDPKFMDTRSFWYGLDSSTITASTALASISGSHYVSGAGGVTNRAGRFAARVDFASELIPVNLFAGVSSLGQRTFTLSARARQTSGTSLNYLLVAFYTAAGTHIPRNGTSDATGSWLTTSGTYHYWGCASLAFPATWSTFTFTVGSGQSGSIPSSAAYMRVGALPVFSNANSVVEIQDLRVRWGTGSEHLINVESTWSYQTNPAISAADYLCNEQFGFGKESRQIINASRYALNSDPMWRRHRSLENGVHWRTDVNSGQGGAIIGTASIALMSGAPVGRRVLVLTASGGSPAVGGYVASNIFPIDPSGVFIASVQARGNGGQRKTFVQLSWLTAQGSYFGGVDIANAYDAPNTTIWSNYIQLVGSGTGTAIPSSARNACLIAYVPYSYGTNNATELHLQEFQVHVGTQIKRFIEPWEQIEWHSVSSAAAWCDDLVMTPSGTQARFAANGQGNTGISYRDNLKNILASGNLRGTYAQSGWQFFGGWIQPDVTFNKADFLSGIEARGAADTTDRYNGVRASFYDRHQDHKLVPSATIRASEYVSRDNSMQLYEDVDLDFVDDWFQAQRNQFLLLEQGDNQMVVKSTLGLRGLAIQGGKQISVNIDVMSWSPKYFIPTELTYDIPRGVGITMREDFAASYTDPTSAEYVPRSGSAIGSSSPYVPFVTSASASPRIDAIELSWTNPSNRSFEWIDIYRNTTNAFSGSTLIRSTRNDAYTDAVRPHERLYYWFVTRDFIGNVSSPWPGLTTSFYTAAITEVGRDPDNIFFDDFNYQSIEEFEQRWQPLQGSGTFTSITSGLTGGRAAQFTGYRQYISRVRIPFEQEDILSMDVRAMLVTSHAQRDMYIGFVGYRADGTTAIDTNSAATAAGGQHYFVAAPTANSSIGLWQEFTGHVSGVMTWPLSGTVVSNVSYNPKNSGRMHPLTRFVSPVVFMNYTDPSSAVTAIDRLRVRRLRKEGLVFDPLMLNTSNWTWARTTTNVNSIGTASNLILARSNSATHFPLSAAGDYNTFILLASGQQPGGEWFIERYRPDFHSYLPDSGSISVSARVYLESDGSGNVTTAEPCVVAYTSVGQIAGFFVGVASGYTTIDAWNNIVSDIPVSVASLSAAGYSAPYFMSLGFRRTWPPSPGNAQPNYISYLQGSVR